MHGIRTETATTGTVPSMTNDPPPDSDISDASQWDHESTAVDKDRSFALLVALWALGLPLFLGILLFAGLLTIESDHNGLWVVIGGLVLLVATTIVILWRNRSSK